jgi:hypothetical protein
LRAKHENLLIDTGQHWDDSMAAVFFDELGLPKPDHALGIGGGSHAEQTARMLIALEQVIAAAKRTRRSSSVTQIRPSPERSPRSEVALLSRMSKQA